MLTVADHKRKFWVVVQALVVLAIMSFFQLSSAQADLAKERQIALFLFEKVSEHHDAPPWLKPIVRAAANELRSAKFLPGDPMICTVSQAYTRGFGEAEIFICDLYFQESTGGRAQILMHEAFHLAGLRDECETTRLELAVLNLLGLHSQSYTAYMHQCGIHAD